MQEIVSASDAASLIDHTILKPEAQAVDIERACDEARQNGFASVCVNPVHIPLVAKKLSGSAVKTCSVVGFPLGATPSAIKAAETEWVVANGADEVDMVIDIGALKAGRDEAVEADIAAVKEACGGKLLKVIIEACLLNDDEKVRACRLAVKAGADFVKTSTGFSSGGATEADIRLMRDTVGPDIGVKASGGVRTAADMRTMVSAGASRIGASAGVKIITDFEAGAGNGASAPSPEKSPAGLY